MAAITGIMQGMQGVNQQNLEKMAEMFKVAGASNMASTGGDCEKKGRTLDANGFSRLDKFDKGEEKWKEWMFDFKVAVKAQHEKVHDLMEKAERMMEKDVAHEK